MKAVSQEVLDQYDSYRDFSTKAFKAVCYAPFVSLYFDQRGDVRVCCQNVQHVVGNITTQRIDDIWNGEKINALRDALVAYDFKLGCRFCEWQLTDGALKTSFMRQFDNWPAEATRPAFPKRMEFSVSNTCNLECIMCNGEWSSSIRARREKLPPIPKVYPDQFFTDLRKYLPHLQRAKFLGGEPFLAHESFRIWDMMIEDGLQTSCHVTTNGTQWNDKVERVLKALPIGISISMDGVSKETVESVRVNAKHEEVFANFQKFLGYCRQKKQYIGLTYCLMQQNWHEFGDYLLFADKNDVEVVVNTVIGPMHCSLHVLPPDKLGEIVEALERQNEVILPKLGRNKQCWIDQLARLKHRLETAWQQPNKYFIPMILTEGSDKFPAVGPTQAPIAEEQARRVLTSWGNQSPIAGWVCDKTGKLETILTDDPTGKLLGIEPAAILNKPVQNIHVELIRLHGPQVQRLDAKSGPSFCDHSYQLTTRKRKSVWVRSIQSPRYDDAGNLTGTLTLATVSETAPAPAPLEVHQVQCSEAPAAAR